MPFGWRVSAEDGWIVFLLVHPPPCQSRCVSRRKEENGGERNGKSGRQEKVKGRGKEVEEERRGKGERRGRKEEGIEGSERGNVKQTYIPPSIVLPIYKRWGFTMIISLPEGYKGNYDS